MAARHLRLFGTLEEIWAGREREEARMNDGNSKNNHSDLEH